jgi:surface antigen
LIGLSRRNAGAGRLPFHEQFGHPGCSKRHSALAFAKGANMALAKRHFLAVLAGMLMFAGGGSIVLSQEQLDTQTKNAPVTAPSNSKSIGAPLSLSPQPVEMQRSGLTEQQSEEVSAPSSPPVLEAAPEADVPVADPVAEAPAPAAAPIAPDPNLVPLPELPPVPTMDDSSYPACRENHKTGADPNQQAELANACMAEIDNFYANVMTVFQQQMIDYQIAVADIYISQVSTDPRYTSAQRGSFYDLTTQEHAKANPDGAYMVPYRLADARYNADRAYLDDRFCFYTRCPKYANVPQEKPVALASAPSRLDVSRSGQDKAARDDEKPDKPKKKKKKKKSSGNCESARKSGGLFGSVLGSVVGQAAGLDAIGTALSAAAGGLLVAEIACSLTEQEQEKAAEVTLELTRAEEVGATASWQSDEREDVSGSSTVTALNTEPSGRRCMSIIDVVIVDGEEARATKQMCRAPGESRYTLQA